jgi:hypothetical protein
MTSKSQRFSITFTAGSVKAIEEVMGLTQESQPEAINRAVRIYAFIERQRAEGKELMVQDKDGQLEPVHIV